MIDGIGSKPFSARTLPPLALPEDNSTVEVIAASRRQFSRSRVEVEEQVKALTNMGRPSESASQNSGGKNSPRADFGQKKNGARGEYSNNMSSRTNQSQTGEGAGSRNKDKEITHQVRDDTRTTYNERQTRPQYTQEVHVDLTQEKTKTEYSSKPVISKDNAFELKKQLQEAQKRAIDESVEDATEEFFSLKAISQKPGQKDVSKENKNALKDALLKVLQQNGAPVQTSHVEITKKDVKETHTETTKIDTQPVEEKPPVFEKNKEETKPVHNPIRPGEIPEDELKKLFV
jgi:hypothetical protein